MKDYMTTIGAERNKPDRIILHAMGEYVKQPDGGVLYAPRHLIKGKVSCHAIITPTGDLIRMRNDDQNAWHGGAGIGGINNNINTLGVEFLLEGEWTYYGFLKRIKTDWLTPAQYITGVELCKEWKRRWHIKDILRHSDVSPGRKFDPGDGFPYERFIGDVG